MAAQNPDVPVGMILIEQQEGGWVLAADPNLKIKKREPLEAPTVQAYCGLNCWLYPSANVYIQPPGGVYDNIHASGSSNPVLSNCSGLCGPCRVDYRNSSALTIWTGDVPWNATSVTLTDTWDTDYIGASITISFPPAGSFSAGGGAQVWQTSRDNTYQVENYWNSIRMDTGCGYSRIIGVNYNVSGAFQFGGQFYGVQAYAGAGV